MALTSLVLFNLSTTLIVLSLLLLLPTNYCLNHYSPPDTTQGLLVEEKTRLGSTPPSCHNKCNKCHPCMAVQVPTMPNHGQVEPAGEGLSLTHPRPMNYFDSSSSSPPSGVGNRYSNYKPLGWKCRCGGHFYNP